MMEFLNFYVSGFWVWLGVTIGIAVAGQATGLTLLGVSRLLRWRQ